MDMVATVPGRATVVAGRACEQPARLPNPNRAGEAGLVKASTAPRTAPTMKGQAMPCLSFVVHSRLAQLDCRLTTVLVGDLHLK